MTLDSTVILNLNYTLFAQFSIFDVSNYILFFDTGYILSQKYLSGW